MTARYQSIFRDDLFSGRTALVTGGGTGIGRCIAHELARLGASVAIVGRRREPLDAVCAEIEASGGRALSTQLNVREEAAVETAVASLAERLGGRIDLLVNNAGGQFASPAAAISPKGWRAVVDSNLNGTFLVSKAVYERSMAAHGGAIVNVVADMWNGFPGMAHTGAARAGVVNLTMTLALEWAASGVRVNAVAPGTILSNGLNNYPPEIQEAAASVAKKNPSGRLGTESEVSAAVVFLLSPAAAYVNGATLRVDGAASLWKEQFLPLGATPPERSAAFEGLHLPTPVPEAFRK